MLDSNLSVKINLESILEYAKRSLVTWKKLRRKRKLNKEKQISSDYIRKS